ncbi:MAG: 2-succinyl-5-enolpyruvyl-6-hydroxy-3-cyclohexene-1-carboxylic-acid synthase [Bacteroidota bacterium]|nr:MAG: 2-succinyl-5-enolpyruvyl-6-hydroxy-3-cyclohexene-1-carboxylic-acid synthase [Bacteroidota bacterium]
MNPKQHIAVLPLILKRLGVEQVVISPGSRNAPLIQVFVKLFGNNCFSIVDERSAGYFALGLAVSSQTPVVVITTSGTAVLNLAPAIAEAYHQGVPLIILSADRPPEWIDQQDNQTIRQKEVFSSNSKAFFEMPVACLTEHDAWYSERIAHECFFQAVRGKPGPVHVNIPLREPLYEEISSIQPQRNFQFDNNQQVQLSSYLLQEWKAFSRILIVCGQMPSNDNLKSSLRRLAADKRIVVLAESIANIGGEEVFFNPDLLFQSFSEQLRKTKPELVVYFGGQVVSKRTKNFLRSLHTAEFWWVSPDGSLVDTFKNLTRIVECQPPRFFEILSELPLERQSEFSREWKDLHEKQIASIRRLGSEAKFSDLGVFSALACKFREQDVVFSGNSSVIRYLQFFQFKSNKVFANRGTSGIDGCLSTSVGVAINTTKTVISILGDLSFVYDSNALWNRRLPSNFKIIVINNKGGGIFSLLDGPAEQDGFIEYIQTNHPVSIEKLAAAYHITYFRSSDFGSLHAQYSMLLEADGPALLEVFTDPDRNNEEYRVFMKKLIDYEQ